MSYRKGLQGLSLVEISIVLIIIAFVTTTIFAAKSLVKSGEQKKLMSEILNIKRAMVSFMATYSYLPGDLPIAGKFFESKKATCTDAPVNTENRVGCNGTGDHIFNSVPGDSGGVSENYMAWQHLELAGLIKGSYLGYHTHDFVTFVFADHTTNPVSEAFDGVLFTPINRCGGTGCSAHTSTAGAALSLDKATFFFMNGVDGFMTPEDMYLFDKKYDDGKPKTGIVISRNFRDKVKWDDGYVTGLDPTDCTTVEGSGTFTDAALEAATYRFGNEKLACVFDYLLKIR